MEDLDRPISLTAEFFTWASKTPKNATEGEYFAKELEKISPEYRYKFFYNIALQIVPFIQSNPNLKKVCAKCGSDDLKIVSS